MLRPESFQYAPLQVELVIAECENSEMLRKHGSLREVKRKVHKEFALTCTVSVVALSRFSVGSCESAFGEGVACGRVVKSAASEEAVGSGYERGCVVKLANVCRPSVRASELVAGVMELEAAVDCTVLVVASSLGVSELVVAT